MRSSVRGEWRRISCSDAVRVAEAFEHVNRIPVAVDGSEFVLEWTFGALWSELVDGRCVGSRVVSARLRLPVRGFDTIVRHNLLVLVSKTLTCVQAARRRQRAIRNSVRKSQCGHRRRNLLLAWRKARVSSNKSVHAKIEILQKRMYFVDEVHQNRQHSLITTQAEAKQAHTHIAFASVQKEVRTHPSMPETLSPSRLQPVKRAFRRVIGIIRNALVSSEDSGELIPAACQTPMLFS